MPFAIRILALAAEIVQSFPALARDLHLHRHAGFAKRAFRGRMVIAYTPMVSQLDFAGLVLP